MCLRCSEKLMGTCLSPFRSLMPLGLQNAQQFDIAIFFNASLKALAAA